MTNISKSVALCCAVFVVGHGILLPGPCPKSLPTMFIEDLDFVPALKSKYLQVVPFVHHSLLFAIPTRNSLPTITKTVLEWQLEYFLRIETKWSRLGDYLIMSSSLTKDTEEKYMGCATNTTVPVKVWFDDRFFIIWSCVKVNDEEHDEAVLLLTNYRKYMNFYPYFANFMEEAKNSSRDYLTEPLINAIPWKMRLDLDEPTQRCPRHSVGSRWYFFSITFLILFLMFIFGVCFKSDTFSRCNNSKTHPFVM